MVHNLKVIAHIYNDFTGKFGIPRQSGILSELTSTIVFEKEYRREEAFRGIEGFSHLWLIWQFSKSVRNKWKPTVRPPRLGGNKRLGVFATRSPFRPNPLGLSCVNLIEYKLSDSYGPILIVSGADLMNETPIYDIKPYLSVSDCMKNAVSGFTEDICKNPLKVVFPQNYLDLIAHDKQCILMNMLEGDPRPSYQYDNTRVYGFVFSNYEIKFSVQDNSVLTVLAVETTGFGGIEQKQH